MNLKFELNKLKNHLGEEVVKVLEKNECFVAGGAITSLFNNKEINDIDIYFRSKEKLIDFIYDTFESNSWVVSHTKKATLVKWKDVDLQMIHFKYFDTPQEIFDTFDYTVCMAAYDFKTKEFVFHDDFLKHNAQRILKFNHKTAFPLISLLRVQKYKERGYSISKPEMLRIAMTCMILEINSYEELKDQLGGMYGVNFDKLFEDVQDEEFSMETALEKIADISYDESYFDMPEESTDYIDPDDIIDNIIGSEIKYFNSKKGEVYRIRHNGELVRISLGIGGLFHTNKYDAIPDHWIKIEPEEYFNNNSFYKFVKPKGDNLVSYYVTEFIYKVGEEVVADGPSLYFNELVNISDSTYSIEGDKVLIEVSIKAEDFINARSHIQAKKCHVIRVVPEAEYIKYL